MKVRPIRCRGGGRGAIRDSSTFEDLKRYEKEEERSGPIEQMKRKREISKLNGSPDPALILWGCCFGDGYSL